MLIQVNRLAEQEPLMLTPQVSDTIADIKIGIQENWGIPPIAQKLIHRKKELCDECASIDECGLSEGTTLLLLVVTELERPDKIITIEIDFTADGMAEKFEEELQRHGICKTDYTDKDMTLQVVLSTGVLLDQSAAEELIEKCEERYSGDSEDGGDCEKDIPLDSKIRVTLRLRSTDDAIAKPTMTPKCSSNATEKADLSALIGDIRFKMMLIGDSGVGKSSFLSRFVDEAFEPRFIPTIGLDYRKATRAVDTKNITLMLWDTSGQERFQSIIKSHASYRGVQAVVCMYDVCDLDSFAHVDHWLSEVSQQGAEGVLKLLVGNKSDMESDRKVTTDEGRKKAHELGISFIETSAKEAEHVDNAVMMMVTELLGKEN